MQTRALRFILSRLDPRAAPIITRLADVMARPSLDATLVIGVVLFVICGVSGRKLGELAKHVWPFITVMYALLFVCMFVPSLVLTLPRALGY